MKKKRVGLLGCTGMVGQQYLQLLANHPQFEIAFLAASEGSSGKKYEQSVEGRWFSGCSMGSFAKLTVHSIEEIELAKKNCDFVFSAISTDAARIYEEKYASAGLPVISNASYHRYSTDIPVLIPEVNPEHLKIIPFQQKNRGWDKGFIVVKPNCSLQSYIIPLHPIHKKYGVKKLIITTLQAISGAGYPGVSSLDITDNVIPYIAKEEEKSELETLKIWGQIQGDKIISEDKILIAAHCNRVPVIDGHMACVSVEFEKKPSREEMMDCWANFDGLNLISAPQKLIVYREEVDRPQPRHDRNEGKGMAVTVGRLRECPVFDYRFVALSHNTIRGAAGGGILNAELLLSLNFL